jgi:hypothetical protein
VKPASKTKRPHQWQGRVDGRFAQKHQVAANPRRLGPWAELAALTMAEDLDWEKAKAIGAGRGITGADQKGVVEVGKAPDCSKSPTGRSSVRALCRARAKTRRRSSVLWLGWFLLSLQIRSYQSFSMTLMCRFSVIWGELDGANRAAPGSRQIYDELPLT